MVALTSVDGRILPAAEAAVSASDRGFTLGDGLFETVRAHAGRLLQLGRHLQRLRSGAALIDLPLPRLASLQSEIEQTLAASGLSDAVVRLSISRGKGQRGLAPPPTAVPTVVISVQPFVPYAAGIYTAGARAVIAGVRRNEWSPLARCKSLSQGDSVLARIEAQRSGADFALLLNTRGTLVSADCANLYAVRGLQLVTSPIDTGALAGITRSVLYELVGSVGLQWVERPLQPDDLWRADEVLLTNVLLEVAPLCVVDGRPVANGKPGPWAAQLRLACRAALGMHSPA